MKKALFTLLAASLLMACGKNKDVDVVFPEPATKADAVSITFDKGEDMKLELLERAKPNVPSSTIADQKVDLTVHSIDLTEDNRYVLYMTEKATKAIKGDVKLVWTGKYTRDGEVYKLERIGDIIRKDDQSLIQFRPYEGVTPVKADDGYISYAASINAFQALQTIAANLARNWTVASTYVNFSGGQPKVSISKSYKGCDLHEIGKDLKDKGFALSDQDVADLSGYAITELNFLGNNNLIMNFDGPASYFGNWEVNGTSFSWSLNNSNKLIDAKASGNISFPSNGQALLVANAVVNAGNEKYIGSIEFTLNTVK